MPFVSERPLEDLLDEDAAPVACERIASAVGDRLESLTKRFTPVDMSPFRDKPDRPRGTAKASVHRTVVERRETARGMSYVVTVRSFDPVFPFIEWSTKPHRIRAKPGGALRWVDASGEHFARSVWHPGTQGQHSFARAALQTEAQVGQIARGPLQRFGRDLTSRVSRAH